MNAFLENIRAHFASQDPLKTASWRRFQEAGIPSYPYLPLSQLRNYKIEAPEEEHAWQKKCETAYSHLLVNGKFQPELSAKLTDEVTFIPLEQALIEYAAFLPGYLEKEVKEEKDAFAQMTAALAEQAYFLYIPPYTSYKADFINIQTAKSAFSRLVILLGRGARLQVVLKNYTQTTSSSFGSELLQIYLEEEASCHIDKIDHFQSKSWAFSFVRAFQKAKSELRLVTATTGSLAARLDMIATLAGAEAKAFLGGAARLKGFCQAHTRALVRHLAPDTTSEQLFKTILEDVTRSSFQGEIYVEPVAVKTNAFQLSKSLLLSDKAISYSKPELQIFADDVKASHGATVGQIDNEMLFYLQSRGISRQEAASLLINSFTTDLINLFGSPLSQSEAMKLLA